jgi:hypothetical protein
MTRGWLKNGNPPGDFTKTPRCGAKTRRGTPCHCPSMPNGRCRLHGGLSSGPKMWKGIERIQEANTKHGRYSEAARESRRRARELQRWVKAIRVAAILEARRGSFDSEWVFPARTRSGHIEQSTLKKSHAQACKGAKLVPFVPYIFRHTCLTRWSAILDPYTLAYLAGHSDFGTTKRYVHPNLSTAREAIARARKAQSGHKIGHNAETDNLARTA